MIEPDDYQRTTEAHLALWNARSEAMKARPARWVRKEYGAQLEEWRAGYKAAFADLAALKAAAGDRWVVIKAELDRAWHALESALPPR